jgi:hypothetical protein
MMGQLERREEAISGEFNSRDMSKMMLACAKIGRKPGAEGKRGDATGRMLGRRSLAFSYMQVASWWDLVQTVHLELMLMRRS